VKIISLSKPVAATVLLALSTASSEGDEKIRHAQNTDAAEVSQHQQVGVAGHYQLRAGVRCALQHPVVVRIRSNNIESLIRMHIDCERENDVDCFRDIPTAPSALVVENARHLGDDRIRYGEFDLAGTGEFEQLQRLAADISADK
jgi:hypothetical protein